LKTWRDWSIHEKRRAIKSAQLSGGNIRRESRKTMTRCTLHNQVDDLLGALAVKCRDASSYRIALNSGQQAGTPMTRKMRNLVTGETVRYSLSTMLGGSESVDRTAAAAPTM
jgi:spore coat protein U-like protein